MFALGKSRHCIFAAWFTPDKQKEEQTAFGFLVLVLSLMSQCFLSWKT